MNQFYIFNKNIIVFNGALQLLSNYLGHIHHDDTALAGSAPVVGTSHYSVNMAFYLDPNFLNPIPGNPLHVPVGTEVYVKVFTTAPDWTVKMRVKSCYAKPDASAPDHLTYYLIKNGYYILSLSSLLDLYPFSCFKRLCLYVIVSSIIHVKDVSSSCI